MLRIAACWVKPHHPNAVLPGNLAENLGHILKHWPSCAGELNECGFCWLNGAVLHLKERDPYYHISEHTAAGLLSLKSFSSGEKQGCDLL